MGVLRILSLALALAASVQARRGRPINAIRPYPRAPLQDIVTWDEHSIYVHGERVFFFSGEVHPFRLPVPGLYRDVFQKIKALGYNGVSFYTMWALLEGEPGVFSANGIFDLTPFFDAASEAGIYLLARPGPYINAEVTGGGFPGWLSRVPGYARTNDTRYLDATNNYASHINSMIAKAQITNGGPVILYQPENEYSASESFLRFPDPTYMAAVERQARDAGIVVPFISNDNAPHGYNAPGTGEGQVDIYGYDGYPLGFDCANPYVWPDGALPTNFHQLHLQQSPTTPNGIVEFQGGSFDPWGGLGFEQCQKLLNHEFERVFYKNNFASGVTLLNIYMTYGGTNWGGISHPGGYTSYDYGAVLTEERLVSREKYSEAKLEANFVMASPALLTAAAQSSGGNGIYSDNPEVFITQLYDNKTRFFVVRHANYSSLDPVIYNLEVPTSAGNLSLPQHSGLLMLSGRDSKIHVVDYAVGSFHLLYSTAEIFTWKTADDKTTLIVYGGPNEHHELAFTEVPDPEIIEGQSTTFAQINGAQVVNWKTTSGRQIISFGAHLVVYLVDRNSVYNYWTLPTTVEKYWKGTAKESSGLIVQAGYLVRNASLGSSGTKLSLVGDLNATVPLEIISGAPKNLKTLEWNGKAIPFTKTKHGVVCSTLEFSPPHFQLPALDELDWRYIDSLPEISSDYDDGAWRNADLRQTHNDEFAQQTPTSLFASDYGFNTGNLLFRGHFNATGTEESLLLRVQGGTAFGMSAWLNDKLLGSCVGIDAAPDCNATFPLSAPKGSPNVITVLQDHMGIDEQYTPGQLKLKSPRGIINYTLKGRSQDAVSWKITGNLGGEQYVDKTRGPLNEGGLFAERQGFHLPAAPISDWKAGKPTDGFSAAGVRFYAAELDLNIPQGYDIPLAFSFGNSSFERAPKDYRAQLYVNGYQYGKYVRNIGPQDTFSVPQGILNPRGKNYVGLSLWALDASGAKIESFSLQPVALIQTGYGPVEMSPAPAYRSRVGAY